MTIDWRDRIAIIGAILVSFLVVSAFALVCTALFFLSIPAEMKELAMLLLGILGAGFTTVINYWTGSTSSAQKKDATIAQTAAAAASTAATVADTAATVAAKGTRK